MGPAAIGAVLAALVAAQCGNVEWIPGNLEDGGALDAAYRIPVNHESYCYVLSNILSSQPWPQETHGSDDAGDCTKSHPFLTFQGAAEAAGARFVEGQRVVFMLGGGQNYVDTGATDGGMYDHLARQPVLDPWDDQVVEMRQYSVRSIFVGGSEAHWNSWSVRGPRKMMRVGTQPTITDFTYERDTDGTTPVGRTKWRYNGDTGGAFANNGPKGLYLRVTRDAGNGRVVEVSQPLQITGSYADSPGSANGYLNTDHGNYYHGQGVYDRDADRFEIVARGAEFIPTAIPGDTGGADAISILGFGAFDTHSRLTSVSGHNEGKNPGATFERVGFENAHVDARGVWFDVCFFYHSANFRGQMEFTGSTVSSQSSVYFEGSSRGIGTLTEINENCGRAVVDAALFPDAGLSDPVFPGICGQSLYGYEGNGGSGKFIIGSDHAPGDFRVWKGFTWEGGVEVRGAASRFTAPDVSHTVHLPMASVALWARNGAQILIDPHATFFGQGANASTVHLKVGAASSDGIQMGGALYASRSSTVPSLNAADDGTFVYGPKWNGNFSRALEYHTADSGYLYQNADFSAIRDSRVWWVE